MTEPVGVVLAAGLATRMGRPKQLLPYRDGTLLGAVLSAARASRLNRICVVLGAYEAEIRQSVDFGDSTVVINPAPERGNLSSLQVAVGSVGVAPLVLLMGDMPGVDAAVIDAHVSAWEGDQAWLRTTRYTDRVGHPLMLSPELVASLDDLEGAHPLWQLVHDERTRTLTVDSPMPTDIDTPDDYDEALARDSAE
ncbi:MAG: nucleotidyltransferase family protein [Acidimicrobiia bacterium]|nr:nucleotidyltransferase family protein [Acidimicrobiia bacterium]